MRKPLPAVPPGNHSGAPVIALRDITQKREKREEIMTVPRPPQIPRHSLKLPFEHRSHPSGHTLDL